MTTVFLRALEADDKAGVLRLMIRQPETLQKQWRFEMDPRSFTKVPGSPFSYWVSEHIRGLFKAYPTFEQSDRIVRQGGVTGNDARFLRAAWEISAADGDQVPRWVPFAKGGSASSWYADYPVVVAWDDRRNTFFGYTGLLHRPSEKPSSADHYFRPGLTWPLRAARFAPVPLPREAVFSIRGYAILADEAELLALAAIGNSAAFDYIFKVALGRFGFPEFVVGVLQKLPLPAASPGLREGLAIFARRAWSLSRRLDTCRETSHAFTLPAVLQVIGDTLVARADAWAETVGTIEAELVAIQAEIDQVCFDLYDIDSDDRGKIADAFSRSINAPSVDFDPDDAPEEHERERRADITSLSAELVSWAAGVAFGRFDIRLAIGARAVPPEPEPFSPLPVCSPAMLAGANGMPLTSVPAFYPEDVSAMLVKDPGHSLDLTTRVRSVFDAVFGEDADRWWTEVGLELGAKGDDIDKWLGRDFFDHHLRTYSKSRRKAPLLWPLGTRSGSYVVWLYAHRVTVDSLFQVHNDLVVPKLRVEERELARMRQDAGPDPTAAQRKAIEFQERFVDELREFREELDAVAPLWQPNFADGTVIVLAPLWRLFAHHRTWSSELKKHWAKLAKGDYDWAHLAMRLWPDRVVAKCAEDRSLAIAHGLEDVFWVHDPDNEDKWLPRQIPLMPVNQLIAQRHNPAAAAALLRADQ